MQSQELPFIQAIQATEAEEPRLIYADWLEDRGDERAEYLRAELAFSQINPWKCIRQGTPKERGQLRQYSVLYQRLREMVDGLPVDWLEAIAIPMDVVAHSQLNLPTMFERNSQLPRHAVQTACPNAIVPAQSFRSSLRWIRLLCDNMWPLSIQRAGDTPFRFIEHGDVYVFNGIQRVAQGEQPLTLFLVEACDRRSPTWRHESIRELIHQLRSCGIAAPRHGELADQDIQRLARPCALSGPLDPEQQQAVIDLGIRFQTHAPRLGLALCFVDKTNERWGAAMVG